MVIAVTYDKETGNVGHHFGKAEWIKLYEINNNGDITDSAVVKPYGQGHEMMVEFLMDYNTEIVICNHLGDAAKDLLAQYEIGLIVGAEGPADNVVDELLKGIIEAGNAAGLTSNCGSCGEDGCDCGSDCGSGCGGCCH